MLRTCCHASTFRVTCPEPILGYLRTTVGTTPPSWHIALDHGPRLPPTHPNSAMGLVLDTPISPLHGLSSDSRELCRATRHLSLEPHSDMTVPLATFTLQRARRLYCRALDLLDGLALGDPPRVGSVTRALMRRFPNSIPGRQLPAPRIHMGLNRWFDLADDSALSITVSITFDKR